MKVTFVSSGCLFISTLFGVVNGAGVEPNIESVDYMGHDDRELLGFVSKPSSATADSKKPCVVVIHDWDGNNLYEQQRVTMFAQALGYVGFAADIYGKEHQGTVEGDLRSTLAGTYRDDPDLFTKRIQTAVDTVKAMPEVDPNKVALVGYCFGGTGVLSYALLGLDGVEAVVSVHGGLSLPEAMTNQTETKILVLTGGDDDTSTEIIELENTLNSIGAEWEITRFSGIQHAWTVFDGSNYDAFADERTWYSMTRFLQEIFGDITYDENTPTTIVGRNLTYTDVDGIELQAFVSEPDLGNSTNETAPCVVILPDWDGNNAYEYERAALFAENGYVGFAADIYGADNLVVEGDARGRFATFYRDNQALFVQRIARAVEEVKTVDSCDPNNIVIAGYCFGGTGVVYYAFSGRDDVKIIAAFHGGLETLPNVATNITPYVLILSGGEDDSHGNQTVLEEALNTGEADWEITRWSGVYHGFTKWGGGAYNLRADARSWDQTLSVMNKLLMEPEEGIESVNSSPDSAAGPFAVFSRLFLGCTTVFVAALLVA